MSNWSDVNRLRLIDEYRKRPGLWCSSHPDYSSHEKRKEAIAEITKLLNGLEENVTFMFTEEDIRNQFKNLKDMYRRKMKRMEQLKAMNHPTEEPTWFYFQRLKFLDSNRTSEVESPTSFDPKPELDHSIDDLINAGFPALENKPDKNKPSTSADPIEFCSNAPVLNEKPTTNTKSTTNRRGTKRSAELPIPEVQQVNSLSTCSDQTRIVTTPTTTLAQALVTIPHALNPPQNVVPKPNSGSVNDSNDDLDCWGKFVVSTVRKLSNNSPTMAIELKKRINDILYEVELRGITDARNFENSK